MVEAPKVCPAKPSCERLPSGQPERIGLRINATDRSPFKSRSYARSLTAVALRPWSLPQAIIKIQCPGTVFNRILKSFPDKNFGSQIHQLRIEFELLLSA